MTKYSAELVGSIGAKPVPESIQSVLDALSQIKFGSIQLTVHEGKFVQVDVTERKRFTS